jgi:two-component system, NarL family, sensor histidine kinase UhpB
MDDKKKTKKQLMQELEDLRGRLSVLEKSEGEKFRIIFENNAAAITIVEPDSTFSMSNQAHYNLTGFTQEELVGMSWMQLIPPDDLERIKAYNRQRHINPQEAPARYEYTFYHKNGGIRHGLMTVTTIPSTRQLITSSIDITESKRAEAALKKSKEQLGLLSARLINAQEKERKRIAYELHDELGQSLVSLKFQLSELQRKSLGGKNGFSQEIALALHTINGMAENIRRISQELLPSVLEHLGLLEALKWLTEDFSNRFRIKVNSNVIALKTKFSNQQEIIIFRILQEALTNIKKHAQATVVTLNVTENKQKAFFSLRDNGKGFHLKDIEVTAPQRTGLGLMAMRERAAMGGGSIEIESEPGNGTLLTVTIPGRRRKPKLKK